MGAASELARGPFVLGTTMVAHQSVAPVGFTRLTDTSLDDTTLRINTGVLADGGINGFTTDFASARTVGATTLTTSQLPAHSHGSGSYSTNNSRTAGSCCNWRIIRNFSNQQTGFTGSDGSHEHTLNMEINYHDVMIVQKD